MFYPSRGRSCEIYRPVHELSKKSPADDPAFEPEKYNKNDLLNKFTTRYNVPMSLENQPSEATLTIAAKLRARAVLVILSR